MSNGEEESAFSLGFCKLWLPRNRRNGDQEHFFDKLLIQSRWRSRSSANMQDSPHRAMLPRNGKCSAAAMKNSIGNDSQNAVCDAIFAKRIIF